MIYLSEGSKLKFEFWRQMQQPEVAIYFFGQASKGSQTYHKDDTKIKNPFLAFQVTVSFRMERHYK